MFAILFLHGILETPVYLIFTVYSALWLWNVGRRVIDILWKMISK